MIIISILIDIILLIASHQERKTELNNDVEYANANKFNF